tara:strand:- start:629 stop:862 length:234 start_codon:yes stop_codon:yes gene_type:complete
METEGYTVKMGITISGSKQFESIRVDVSETVTLDAREKVDDQIKDYSFRQLRKSVKLKVLEAVTDAKEAAALSRGKQ